MSALSKLRSALARDRTFEPSRGGQLLVTVALGDRSHRVRIESLHGWYRITGRIILKHGLYTRQLLARILHDNAPTELVCLHEADDWWLTARADLPHDTPLQDILDAITAVARRADDCELIWTGADDL